MQIHEITQHPDALLAEVTLPSEWLGQKAKGAASSVAKGLGRTASAIGNTTPFKKAAAVFNNPGAMTSARGYGDAMNTYYKGQVDKTQAGIDAQIAGRLAQQTQQRAKELAQQWIQQVQAKKPTVPASRAKPGQMPASVAASKTGQNMQQMFGQPKGGIQGMQSDLEEAASMDPAKLARMKQRARAPAPTVTPTATPTTTTTTADPKTIMTGSRAKEFKTWVDQQLTSTVTGTNQTISMAQVRQDPETLKKLNALLPTIIMKNDPTAIEQYLTIAMTAMQQLSAQIKQQQKSTTTAAGGSGTQTTPLSSILNQNQIDALQKKGKDPTGKWEIIKTLGLQ